MKMFTTDQLLVLLGYAGAMIAIYVSMTMRIKALEIEMKQLQEESKSNRHDSQKLDEKVAHKFDAIMDKIDEKFNVINRAINELIKNK